MVGPLTVLKMLHCRSLGRSSNKGKRMKGQRISSASQEFANKRCSVEEDIDTDIKMKTVNELCRVCLKQGSIPIHRDNSSDDLSAAISTFADIDITPSDPYPKYLCYPCNALLQGAILLRKTAQDSDERLRKPVESDQESVNNFSDFAAEKSEDDFAIDKTEEPGTSVELKFTLTCKQCEIQFDTFDEYNDHKLSPEHENKKKTCPICNKSYAPNYFKIHLKIHKGKTSYLCDVCGKNFTLQYQFKRHRLTHFYSLPFKCSLCPYKGRFSESLKMHMRSHTGEKPYICDECPQRFISKSNLNKHMLTHKKEHDFRCECGRGFYTKRELDLHFKVEHTGIKDHICCICGKAFGYRKQLMKHERKVHNREKLKTGRMPIYLKLENMKQQENNTSQLLEQT